MAASSSTTAKRPATVASLGARTRVFFALQLSTARRHCASNLCSKATNLCPVIWSAHLSMLFREVAFERRPAEAARCGFRSVEAWWPTGVEDRFVTEVERLGLSVALLNAYGGDIEAGERGFLNVPERREEAITACRRAVGLACRCGAPRINILVGRAREGTTRAVELDLAIPVLRECAAIAERVGIEVVVEPLNALDVPGSLVPSVAVAVEVIERVGYPNVRLLYDAYHVARAGVDPCAEVSKVIPLVGHVQFADHPGRGAPGTGELDLAAFVARLEAGGYEGAIGLEFDPHGPTEEALAAVRIEVAG